MQKAEILILDFPLISCLSYNHGSYASVLLCATPSSHDSIWGIISRWDRDRSIHENWLHSISSLHFHKSLWGILKTKDTLRLFIWPVTTASWHSIKSIAHWWIWPAMNFYTGSNHSSGTAYVWLLRAIPSLIHFESALATGSNACLYVMSYARC